MEAPNTLAFRLHMLRCVSLKATKKDENARVGVATIQTTHETEVHDAVKRSLQKRK